MIGPKGVFSGLVGRYVQKAELDRLTVFFMQFSNLECVLSILYGIIVCFVIPSDGCQLWARKRCQRMEEQAVAGKCHQVKLKNRM